MKKTLLTTLAFTLHGAQASAPAKLAGNYTLSNLQCGNRKMEFNGFISTLIIDGDKLTAMTQSTIQDQDNPTCRIVDVTQVVKSTESTMTLVASESTEICLDDQGNEVAEPGFLASTDPEVVSYKTSAKGLEITYAPEGTSGCEDGEGLTLTYVKTK